MDGSSRNDSGDRDPSFSGYNRPRDQPPPYTATSQNRGPPSSYSRLGHQQHRHSSSASYSALGETPSHHSGSGQYHRPYHQQSASHSARSHNYNGTSRDNYYGAGGRDGQQSNTFDRRVQTNHYGPAAGDGQQQQQQQPHSQRRAVPPAKQSGGQASRHGDDSVEFAGSKWSKLSRTKEVMKKSTNKVQQQQGGGIHSNAQVRKDPAGSKGVSWGANSTKAAENKNFCWLKGHDHLWKKCPNNPRSVNYNGIHSNQILLQESTGRSVAAPALTAEEQNLLCRAALAKKNATTAIGGDVVEGSGTGAQSCTVNETQATIPSIKSLFGSNSSANKKLKDPPAVRPSSSLRSKVGGLATGGGAAKGSAMAEAQKRKSASMTAKKSSQKNLATSLESGLGKRPPTRSERGLANKTSPDEEVMPIKKKQKVTGAPKRRAYPQKHGGGWNHYEEQVAPEAGEVVALNFGKTSRILSKAKTALPQSAAAEEPKTSKHGNQSHRSSDEDIEIADFGSNVEEELFAKPKSNEKKPSPPKKSSDSNDEDSDEEEMRRMFASQSSKKKKAPQKSCALDGSGDEEDMPVPPKKSFKKAIIEDSSSNEESDNESSVGNDEVEDDEASFLDDIHTSAIPEHMMIEMERDLISIIDQTIAATAKYNEDVLDDYFSGGKITQDTGDQCGGGASRSNGATTQNSNASTSRPQAGKSKKAKDSSASSKSSSSKGIKQKQSLPMSSNNSPQLKPSESNEGHTPTSSKSFRQSKWLKEELKLLKHGVRRHGDDWELISRAVKTRSPEQCKKRAAKLAEVKAAAATKAKDVAHNTANMNAENVNMEEPRPNDDALANDDIPVDAFCTCDKCHLVFPLCDQNAATDHENRCNSHTAVTGRPVFNDKEAVISYIEEYQTRERRRFNSADCKIYFRPPLRSISPDDVTTAAALPPTASSRSSPEEKQSPSPTKHNIGVLKNWNTKYNAVLTFKAEQGHINIPKGYKPELGDLYSWFANQKNKLKKGTQPPARAQKLKQLGVEVQKTRGRKKKEDVFDGEFAMNAVEHLSSKVITEAGLPLQKFAVYDNSGKSFFIIAEVCCCRIALTHACILSLFRNASSLSSGYQSVWYSQLWIRCLLDIFGSKKTHTRS